MTQTSTHIASRLAIILALSLAACSTSSSDANGSTSSGNSPAALENLTTGYRLIELPFVLDSVHAIGAEERAGHITHDSAYRRLNGFLKLYVREHKRELDARAAAAATAGH